MFIAFSLVILSIMVHEAGHAIAMYSRKIELKEIGLGFPIPLVPRFKIKSGRFPGITFIISPILIGAYVRPTINGEWQLENLAGHDKALIMGAGVIANLIFASVLQFFLIFQAGLSFNLVLPVIAIILLWSFRKILCQFLLPIAGTLFLGYLLFNIAQAPTDTVAGPIGIGALVMERVKDIWGAIDFGFIITLSLGLMNMLPFYPLDGGKIIDIWVKKKIPSLRNVYRFTGAGILLLFILLLFASDLIRVF